MEDIRKVVKQGYEKGHYAKTFKRNRTKLNKFEQIVLKQFDFYFNKYILQCSSGQQIQRVYL